MSHFNQKTVEELRQDCCKSYLDTPERFIEMLDRRVQEEKHIGNAQIELEKYLALQKVKGYIAARQAYRDKLDRQYAAERAIRQEKQEEKERQGKLAKERKRASLLGWGDTMSELQLGKVLDILSVQYRYDGVVKTRLQHIIDSVTAGYRPHRLDNVVSYYGSRWDKKKTKPKTVYRIVLKQDECDLSYPITKTEFDFATFLVQKQEECHAHS